MTSEGIPSNAVIKRREKAVFQREELQKKEKKNRKDFLLYKRKLNHFPQSFNLNLDFAFIIFFIFYFVLNYLSMIIYQHFHE